MASEKTTYKVPAGARGNAKKVLEWKRKHGKEVKGMTSVGWNRARQLATQSTISVQTVKRMAAFNRHRKNAQIDPKFKDTPWKDRGYVAWLGWGGTTGVDWARRITGAMKKSADSPFQDVVEKAKALKRTRAEPHERKRGSKKNKKGSAKNVSGKITFSAATVETLKKKVKEHNKKSSKKVNLRQLKAVYRRGAGAFSGSHHPKANRHSWSMGRVNSFLRRVKGGKGHSQDDDLIKKSRDDISKGGFPVGTVRSRKDGDYRKQADGSWSPVKKKRAVSDKTAKKKPKTGAKKKSSPKRALPNPLKDEPGGIKLAQKMTKEDAPGAFAPPKRRKVDHTKSLNPWKRRLGHLDLSGYPPDTARRSQVEESMSGDIHSHWVLRWEEGGQTKYAYTRGYGLRNAAEKWRRTPTVLKKLSPFTRKCEDLAFNEEAPANARDAASVLAIMAKTGCRVGLVTNFYKERTTREGKTTISGARGALTLGPENVTIDGDNVSLDFLGKKGVQNSFTFRSPKLATYLAQRKEERKGEDFLFETNESELKRMMPEMGLKGVKMHDLRTARASIHAANAFAKLATPPPPLPRNRQEAITLIAQRVREASSVVGRKLNNGAATARDSYVHPSIIWGYMQAVGAQKLSKDLFKAEFDIGPGLLVNQMSADVLYQSTLAPVDYGGSIKYAEMSFAEEPPEDLEMYPVPNLINGD